MSIITTMRVLSRARCGKILGSLSKHDGDSNENGKKSNGFRQAKQQLCTCITFFGTFRCRRCTTTKTAKFIFANI